MRAPQTKTDIVAGLVWAVVVLMLTTLGCVAWAVYHGKPIYQPCGSYECCMPAIDAAPPPKEN